MPNNLPTRKQAAHIPETPSLVRAAADGDLDAVQAMLAAGADVNTSSAGGQTALMLASVFGHQQIVAVLLLAGANTSMQDGRGLTAAEWCIRRGFLDIAQLIENAPQHSREPRHPPLPKLENANQVDTKAPVPKPSEVMPSPAAAATPKLGGAAAAILRTNAARMDHAAVNHDVTQVPSLDEPVVLFNDSLLAEVAHEQTDKPGPFNEPQFQTPPDEFLWAEPSEKSHAANATHVLVSDARVAAEAPADEGSVEADESEVETPVSISANENTLLSENFDPATDIRPQSMAPAFLAHSSQPHGSGRTIVWALVIVTLGASMYGAYRLNNYISRPRAAAPAAAPIEPPKVTESVPEPIPATTPQTTPPAGNTATEGETADYRTPITGGDLAGTEANLLAPNYPNSARTQGVSAVITITVRVNRRGRVISWLTGTGDSRLRAAALKAAKQSTFNPEKLPGKGEVVGTITYNFR